MSGGWGGAGGGEQPRLRVPRRGQRGGDATWGGEWGGSCPGPKNGAGSGADVTCLHEDVLLLRNISLAARNRSDSAEIFQAF